MLTGMRICGSNAASDVIRSIIIALCAAAAHALTQPL